MVAQSLIKDTQCLSWTGSKRARQGFLLSTAFISFIVPLNGAVAHTGQTISPPVATTVQPETTGNSPAVPPVDATTVPSKDVADIIVTANRRSESLSRAPIAVSVLSQAQLTSQGITSPKDLTRVIPNLQLGVNGAGDGVIINLRGIQSSNVFSNGDPAVAVYIDGINIPRTQGLNGDLYDLARVEVLRGPQGTLYGRNATAGSLNIITAPPTFTTSAHLDAAYGNYNDVQTHGTLNLPVSDTLAIRASFATHRNGGYFDNKGTLNRRYDRADDYSGRLAALWKPIDGLSWQLSVSDYESRGTSNPGVTTAPDGRPLNGLPVFEQPASPVVQPKGHINSFGIRSRIDYKISDALSIDYLAGYGRVRQETSQVNIGQPLPLVLGSSLADIELARDLNTNFSHEVDLSYDHGRLKNILGATYFSEKNTNIADFTVYNYGINFNFTIPDTNQQSYGFFDQATYEIASWIRATAGIRYSHDQKRNKDEFIQYCPPFTADVRNYSPNPACFVTIPNDTRGHWSSVNYKVGVDIDVSSTTLAFFNIATGYKAGGLNDSNTPGILAPGFRPEKVKNYELGIKTRLFDNRLQLSLDSFYIDYSDLQVTQVQQPVGDLTVNAASAKIYGAELEATWLVSPNDRFTGFASYLHARYGSFNNAVDQLNGGMFSSLRGHELPNAPSVSLRGRYQHDFHIASFGTLSPSATVYWQKRSYLREFNLKIDQVPSYSKTQLSLLYRNPSKKWSVEGFVENLENRKVRSAQFVLAGAYLSYYDPPRTYGLRVSHDF